MTDLLKSEKYIGEHRAETIETMSRFATTDLLLFWSNEEELRNRQQKIWQPFLDELSIKINISDDLQIPENKLLLKVLKSRLLKLNNNELTAAFLASTLLKSVILGISLLAEENNVEKVFTAAFLEELYQNELWGTDKEVAEKREAVKSELHKIKEYLHND